MFTDGSCSCRKGPLAAAVGLFGHHRYRFSEESALLDASTVLQLKPRNYPQHAVTAWGYSMLWYRRSGSLRKCHCNTCLVEDGAP
jgi:hypothetical protein